MSNLVLAITKVECNTRGNNPPKLKVMLGNISMGKINLDNPSDTNQLKPHRYDPANNPRRGNLGLYQGGDPCYLGVSIQLDQEIVNERYKFNDTENGDANCRILIHYSISEA